jgi:hypothetical protein
MDFVTYEIGKKLQEKGYTHGYNRFGYLPIYSDECTIRYLWDTGAYDEEYYGEFIPCPTIVEVLDWLRKEHHLHFEVVAAAYGYNLIISDTPDKGGTDRYFSHANDDRPNDGGAWDEYRDCVLYGIKYVLDNLI